MKRFSITILLLAACAAPTTTSISGLCSPDPETGLCAGSQDDAEQAVGQYVVDEYPSDRVDVGCHRGASGWACWAIAYRDDGTVWAALQCVWWDTGVIQCW